MSEIKVDSKNSIAWGINVPDSWQVMHLGKCIDFARNGCSETQTDESDDTVPVTRIESISSGAINRDAVGHVRSHMVGDKYRLEIGDMQFSNINSLSMIGNCALFLGGDALYAGMNLLHIRPKRDRLFPKYLHWVMKAKWFRNQIEANAKPAINQASIPSSSLRRLSVPVPALPKQKQIAAFLDYETAKIDALIAMQQQLIALLGEKRQAVISHAVTKGLNPDAPMRDSGIEWLGEVPEHWRLMPLHYAIGAVIDCKNRTPPEVEDGPYAYVRTSNVRDGKFLGEDLLRTSEAGFRIWTHRGIPQPGDVFFTREAPAGEACLVPEGAPMCMGQRMMRMTPGNHVDDSRFILYSMLGPQAKEYAKVTSHGSTVSHIRIGAVRRMPFLVPPKEEQIAIADQIEAKWKLVESLIGKANGSIKLLQERRTALISAAVTGKIDVRGWKPPSSGAKQETEMEVA